VDITCRERHFQVQIPPLAGLAVLKIGAIRDKQDRLDKIGGRPRRAGQLPHETARLALHAADLVLVRSMLDATRTLPALTDLRRRHPEVRQAALDASAWSDEHDDYRASVSRLQPVLAGSPDPLAAALWI